MRGKDLYFFETLNLFLPEIFLAYLRSKKSHYFSIKNTYFYNLSVFKGYCNNLLH